MMNLLYLISLLREIYFTMLKTRIKSVDMKKSSKLL